MRKIFILLFILLVVQNTIHAQNIDKENSCVSCHVELEYMPEDYAEYDIHNQPGLSCVGCHGGDAASFDEEEAMSSAKGFIGIPDAADIPRFCGKCHSDINFMRTFRPRISTDQESQYFTSLHGIKLKKGDTNVATCIDCHTSHNILPAKDTRSSVYAVNIPGTCEKCHGDKDLMDSYNLPSNQYDEFTKSIHGTALLDRKDIGAPACNDCHGNHGALPPGLSSISHVCGLCHANNMEYFENSVMSDVFEHACEECHGNHYIEKTSDAMIGVGEESLCNDCHEDDKGYEVAEKISNQIGRLVSTYDSVEVKLQEVKAKGMNDVDIEFALKDAKQRLIQSRTLVHTFDVDRVKEKIDEGMSYANTALKDANEEIDEYYTRRNGFALATIALLLLTVGLFLKVRQLRKK